MSGCLICGSLTSQTAAAVSNSGIRKIYLFHKILQIPLSRCWEWLDQDGAGPSLCEGCSILVDQGVTLVQLIGKLEAQLKGVQFKVNALLLNQGNIGGSNTLRSTLISEIQSGLNFVGNAEELRVDTGGQVDEEDDDGCDGIGIITETTSLSTGYQSQCQGQVEGQIVAHSNNGGVETSEDAANLSQEELLIEEGTDPHGEVSVEHGDESRDYSSGEECDGPFICKVDPWTVNGTRGMGGDEQIDEDYQYSNMDSYSHDRIPVWSCKGCGQVFDTRKQLRLHRRVVHQVLPINQNLARKKFGVKKKKVKNSMMQLSTRVGPRKNSYICLLCNKSFGNSLIIHKHYAQSHPNTTKWPCLSCDKVFSTRSSLYYHKRDYHKNGISWKKKAVSNSLQEIVKMKNVTFRQLKIILRKTLKKLGQEDKFTEFARPVNPEEVPDYLEVISHPMDFEAMMIKLNRNIYSNTTEFLKDIDLIFSNCITYNPQTTEEDKLLRHRAFELKDVARKWIENEMNSSLNESGSESEAENPPTLAEEKTENGSEVVQILSQPNSPITSNLAEEERNGNIQPVSDTSPPVLNIEGSSRVYRKAGVIGNPTGSKRYICVICDKDCGTLPKLSKHYARVHPDTSNWPCFACDRVFIKRASLYCHRKQFHNNLPGRN